MAGGRARRSSLSYQSPIVAPVAQGTVVGKLIVGGQGNYAAAEWPLVTGAAVPRVSLPGRAIVAVLLHMVLGGHG